LLGIKIGNLIIEIHGYNRQAENRNRTDIGLSLYGTHFPGNRERDEFFYFFRTAAGPLRNDAGPGIGYIRVSFYQGVFYGNDTAGYQQESEE
jgi:hypothetical protein